MTKLVKTVDIHKVLGTMVDFEESGPGQATVCIKDGKVRIKTKTSEFLCEADVVTYRSEPLLAKDGDYIVTYKQTSTGLINSVKGYLSEEFEGMEDEDVSSEEAVEKQPKEKRKTTTSGPSCNPQWTA